MDASILDYELPPERIARFPAQKRDESRLLLYERKSGRVEHLHFRDLPNLLSQQFDFFINDASVLKARIFANKESGGMVECLALSPSTGDETLWTCMLRPAKRLKIGSTFYKEGFFKARVMEKFDDGTASVKFELAPGISNMVELTESIGVVPLPPYIGRDQRATDYDRDFDNVRYGTVYADPQKRVAAAAPTAGLHFTNQLINGLKDIGHEFYKLTLHVGIGTFKPMTSQTVEGHRMHCEVYEIPPETLKAAIKRERPNLAVGTTSLRALEDFYRKHHSELPKYALASAPYIDSASLFVYPPQKLLSADAMITNFHLPRSTLMCLVSAFISPGAETGIKTLKELYRIAIDKSYNFYSYGDAMLIL